MKILVTGGAGFIGSNIVEALLEDKRVTKVTVLDNFSTGFKHNIEEFFSNPNFSLVEGDIRDYETCLNACKNMDIVCHQAALGSVPRSINDPLTTNAVNISGTLNVYTAAKNAGIKRIVYAASSSTYGDSQSLPKVEGVIGKPLSPYAVTKYVNELYAEVYSKTYGIQFIGLRYFNVFGPKQSPTGAYAAVVPLFINALLKGETPTINGEGTQSRDFTYIGNTVQANLKALFCENDKAWNEVYNVAVGDQTTVVEMYNILKEIAGSKIQAKFGPTRKGDIEHSLADISKAVTLLKYKPSVHIKEGLKNTFEWFKKQQNFK